MIRIIKANTGIPRPNPVRSRFKLRLPPKLRGWVIPVAGFLVWWIAARLPWPQESLFVSPQQVAASGIGLAKSGELIPAVGASLLRLALGFTIGSLLGTAIGTWFGVSRTVERILGPTFHAVKQVSLFAWIPLIAMWFGLGESSKIAVLSYSAFFPMLLNTYEGVRSVPREHLEAARAFAFTRPQILFHVILPSALPSIFTGIALALIYAWVSTLGAEYLLTSSVGLGTLLVEGREHAQLDQVLFAVFIVGCVGQLLNFLSGRLESHFLRWRAVSTGRY